MPLYQCITPAGTVPDSVRPQIAKEITRLHVEATNAPPSFVHVIILDVPAGAHYTGGEPDTHTTLISGTIRAGRSVAVRQNLMKGISQSWSNLTGQPEEQLLINISEVDASTVMEAGLLLPQPGEEAAWFEHNRARLSALAPDGIKGL
jgi:phenylpyruvate tautomerase PptA (4-oxalocrotonate tautomerase family)